MKNYLILIMIFSSLSGCGSRQAAAPVVNVGQNKNNSLTNVSPITSTKYRVQQGETLYSIAWRANTDYKTLAKINKIPPPYRIHVGQYLILKEFSGQKQTPVKPSTTVAKTHQTDNKSSNKALANKKQQEYGQNSSTKKTKSLQTDDRVSPVTARGNIKWHWPAQGSLITEYSAAELGSKGIEIAGKTGTKVLAAADGKVVYAGNALRGYGNLVIIKHDNDYLSAYAHNQRLLVKDKQIVKAGQHIADMGNSESSLTKLKFEIRFRGQSVDPMKYLPKRL